MGIVAIIPVAQMAAANAALTALGFGPVRFSVPAYSSGNPTHGCLHDWGTIPTLVTSIKAQPGVTWNEGTGSPPARLRTLLSAANTQWGDDAPDLPTSGNAIANTLYTYSEELWWCIQTFDRSTFNLPPSNYPALFRRARRPGEILPWVQPIDQFDSYSVVNPFNGLPDRVTHNGKTWDSLISNNTFTPGVANWREFVEGGFPAWLQPTGAGDAYPVGFRVSHLSQNWQNTSPANTFAPGVFGWTVV